MLVAVVIYYCLKQMQFAQVVRAISCRKKCSLFKFIYCRSLSTFLSTHCLPFLLSFILLSYVLHLHSCNVMIISFIWACMCMSTVVPLLCGNTMHFSCKLCIMKFTSLKGYCRNNKLLSTIVFVLSVVLG